ncbi:MAG: hypothetical protein QNJ36_22385 [Calothrix sp. MO_167.B42]|nr:hypothetical protein [Calothrix sp. MO_167.B42]
MSDVTDNNCFITDPKDLGYISDVVNQLLENHHQLANIIDVQAALKEVSLERGRELQINLVFEDNLLAGFNFSFTSDPNKTTPNIALKQQEININSYHSDIIPHQQSAIIVDIAASNLQNNLAISSPSPKEIILTPGLQVEDQQIINPYNLENHQTIETPSSRAKKINPSLIGTAHQLANQHEVNGLLLTGLGLKTGIYITNNLQNEGKPDIQNAGLAIIKRFQQILPEEFIAFKAGDSPQAFKWEDPESNKQYHFYFETAQTNEVEDIITPASLKGFEITSSSDSMKPVFFANLIDVRYNHWSIEQCDFNQSQIQSLNLAAKQKNPHHTTAIANTSRDFYPEI